MFLLLKLNVAPFNNYKISVKHVGNMYIIACDVNTFAKSPWSAVNNRQI